MEGISLDQALRVAGRLGGSYPLAESYHLRVLEEAAAGLVHRAYESVEEETGLSGDGPPTVAVIDRSVWVERNLAFFSALLGPVTEEVGGRLAEAGISNDLSRRLVAIETGALLGLLSRRVLGQYELVLPSSEGGDEICLLAPNILEFERKHQLRPAEFRFWVALHEATHRLQFVGVPWLRSYFFDLATKLVSDAKPDRSRMAILVSEVRRAGVERRSPLGEAGLLGLMATPAERLLIDKVQALMSLLEGHGHVVMDRIGSRRLVSWRRMSTLVARRPDDPRVAKLLRLSGLEMKIRQYEEGRDFILSIEKRAGWSTLDLAWESPDALPTRAEISDPESWLARVG